MNKLEFMLVGMTVYAVFGYNLFGSNSYNNALRIMYVTMQLKAHILQQAFVCTAHART